MSIVPTPNTEAEPATALAHAPARGWTAEKKALFLDRLAGHGNARAACRAVRLSPEAAYRLRRRDPLFARGWDAALVLARDNAIQVIGERAIEGLEEDVWFRGEVVGTRRRFDTRLLLAHMARLDALADEETAGEDAARFDELLTAMAEESEMLPDRREDFVETAGEAAANAHRMTRDRGFFDFGTEGEHEDPAWSEEAIEAWLHQIDGECAHVAEGARREAGEAWDRRQTTEWERIDAIIARDEAPPAPGLPGHRADAAPRLIVERIAAAALRSPPVRATPRTVSTASTSALARMLCNTAPPRDPTPRSPFSAPRR